ncbi:MAG TPA: DUF72 domain-containing protein [Xanthobacteraceae bacterium]|jgi:uncharacterized protein YecE (DUF72 family)
MRKLWIGTSGWTYDRWRGVFYPAELPKKSWLSWYDDEIYELLHAHDVALCLSDHHEAPAPWEVTARHVYVRGHGPGGRYRDHYPDTTLRAWARHICKWKRQRRTVFVFFDNDQKSAAPLDAMRVIAMLPTRR